jgi:hypothetical protein
MLIFSDTDMHRRDGSLYGGALTDPKFKNHNNLYEEGEKHWKSVALDASTKTKLSPFVRHIPDTDADRVLHDLLKCSISEQREKYHVGWAEFVQLYMTMLTKK